MKIRPTVEDQATCVYGLRKLGLSPKSEEELNLLVYKQLAMRMKQSGEVPQWIAARKHDAMGILLESGINDIHAFKKLQRLDEEDLKVINLKIEQCTIDRRIKERDYEAKKQESNGENSRNIV